MIKLIQDFISKRKYHCPACGCGYNGEEVYRDHLLIHYLEGEIRDRISRLQ